MGACVPPELRAWEPAPLAKLDLLSLRNSLCLCDSVANRITHYRTVQ
jgi:hypothetical protein